MKLRHVISASIATLIVAGVVAPYLSADRFGERIRRSLEAALGRQVEIGKAHFDLFRGPGFSIQDVVIHEDPAIGLEPVIYTGAGSLEARISLSSLWKGRLEFSTLRLDEPSINLYKAESGTWNFERLLSRRAQGAQLSPFHMPSIVVRGGRLNFRFGDLKSVFYMTDVDVDVTPPPGGAGNWQLSFSGSPARTDHTSQGFGRMRGTARWESSGPDPRVDVNLQLEKSEIVEIVELVRGHGLGVHGLISSRAHLAGPMSDIRIAGRIEISDVHRWDLMPPQGQGWLVDYRGRLDLPSQQLEVTTVSSTRAPLTVRFRAFDYLSQPRWALAVALDRFPLGPVLEAARHLGAPFPEQLRVEGEANGVIAYSRAAGLQGSIALNETAVADQSSGGVLLERPQLVIAPAKIQLLPATVQFGKNETAEIEGEYASDAQALDLKISTSAMTVADFRSGTPRLLGAASVPMLDNVLGGIWNGSLRYLRRGDKPPEWSGNFQLRAARIEVPGIADPLQIASASVALESARATMSRIRARVGKVDLAGDYRYVPQAARPHQLRLDIPKLDAAELERLMMPSLRRQGFIARALRLGRPAVPDWLAAREGDAILDIGAFTLGDMRVESLHTRLIWDATDVQAMELEGRFRNGELRGRLAADLSGFPPLYSVGLHLRSADWSDGKLEVTLNARTSGIGMELWPNLRGDGFLNGKSISLNPDVQFQDVSGCYEFALARGIPRLRFTGVQATLEDESFFGQGSSQPDGRVVLELSNGARQVRVSGTLSPLQWEVIATR